MLASKIHEWVSEAPSATVRPGGKADRYFKENLSRADVCTTNQPEWSSYWPRDVGSTPAKVSRSTMRKSPGVRDGRVGRQLGSIAK